MDEEPKHSVGRAPIFGARSHICPVDVDQIMVIPDTPDRIRRPRRNFRGVCTSAPLSLSNSSSVILDKRSQLCSGTAQNREVHSCFQGSDANPIVLSSSSKNDSSSTRVEGMDVKYAGKHKFNKQHAVDTKASYTESLGTSDYHRKNNGSVSVEHGEHVKSSAKPVEKYNGIGKVIDQCLPANNSICIHTPGGSSESTRNDSKGKLKIVNDKPHCCDADDFANQVASNHNSGTISSVPQCARVPGRIMGKKLVLNGCISPQNIAKANHLSESSANGHADAKSNAVSGGSNHVIDVDEVIAKENAGAREKGKGVVIHPHSLKGCEDRKDDARCCVKLQGRRFHETNSTIGQDNSSSNETLLGTHPLSFGSSASEPLLQLNEGTSCKRQRRHDPASCSTEKSPEVICLTSDATSLTMKSNGYQRDLSSPVGVIELSPELRESESQTEAREIQLQADEILARELQEQLYNEVLVDASGERGSQSGLRRQLDIMQHASSSGNQRRNTARLLPGPNSRRQPQSRSSRNRLRRRGTRASVPRERITHHHSSNFPFGIGFLDALEAAAIDRFGVANELLDFNLEFDENDYELLLALDENNHEHLGASTVQIANLPESRVQNDNCEACSICLETPAIGDTIRHLPCLHKFHRDCIDPWLRRKKSCPVCKSDII